MKRHAVFGSKSNTLSKDSFSQILIHCLRSIHFGGSGVEPGHQLSQVSGTGTAEFPGTLQRVSYYRECVHK